jgi:hypothetical protein
VAEGSVVEHKTWAGLRARAKRRSKIVVRAWKIPGQLEEKIVKGGQGIGGKKNRRAGAVDLNDDDVLHRKFWT